MFESLNYFYLSFAIIFCFLMTWGVGANDLANVMSTTMGSKAITVKKAIIIAITFELLGAFFGGDGVTETMRDGIINVSDLEAQPKILIEGMLSILLAGTIWMNLATYFGLPVSITNAIVGSFVGFGAIILDLNAIHWEKVSYIAISWLTAPMIAGVTAYILMVTLQLLIFSRRDPITKAKIYLPFYLFLIGIVFSFITVFKGLHHFGIYLKVNENLLVILLSSIIITIIGMRLARIKSTDEKIKRRDRFIIVEKQFTYLVAFTACIMVFAHGANDVSIAVGPLSLIHSLLQRGVQFDADSYPYWITLLGCAGVIGGLIFYGRKVIETVGSSITALTPSRAFAATLAAATTVVISTSTGIPVSATQTLVGAVLGVGLARGIGALNLIVIRNIFMSWIITLPASSFLTIACYYFIRYLFKNT